MARSEGFRQRRAFEIVGYLTEIIVLGGIAQNVGDGVKMDWDGPGM